MMDWLKKAPPSIVITVILVCFLGVLAVLGGFIALDLAGQDTSDYRSFVNTVANLIMLPIGGVSAVAAISAAKSAGKTEENTNGHLAQKSADIASEAVRQADNRSGR